MWLSSSSMYSLIGIAVARYQATACSSASGRSPSFSASSSASAVWIRAAPASSMLRRWSSSIDSYRSKTSTSIGWPRVAHSWLRVVRMTWPPVDGTYWSSRAGSSALS